MKPPFPYRKIRMIVATIAFSTMCLSFLFPNDYLPALFQLQFAPALSRAVFSFSVAAALVIVALCTITIIFGRVYCAVFCPLGIAQDVIDACVPRKLPVSLANPRALRYLIAVVTFALLFGGYAIGFRLLEPYSFFGAMLGGSHELIMGGGAGASTNANDLRVATWLLPIAALMMMVIWKRRLFCVSLCPIGTVLGIMAKSAVYRINFEGACVGCGRCAYECPVDCMDVKSRHIDNERCVRCMNCISACPKEALSFSRNRHEKASVQGTESDSARRNFLIRSTVAAFGVVVAGCGTRYFLSPQVSAVEANTPPILPPGAMDMVQFSKCCTHCLLCVAACPTKIIRPATLRYGHVYVDLRKGQCQYDCVSCSRVCPTGAIQPLTLRQKQRLRIGVGSYHPRNCRVLHQEVECGLCAKACPTGAISLRFTVTGLAIPQLDDDKCIGCGACQAACPVTPKAIMVNPLLAPIHNRVPVILRPD